jgi:hypothetical protein
MTRSTDGSSTRKSGVSGVGKADQIFMAESLDMTLSKHLTHPQASQIHW